MVQVNQYSKSKPKVLPSQTLNCETRPSQHLNSNDCFVEKPAFECDRLKNYTLVQSSCIKEENDVSDAARDHQASHELTSMVIAVSETVLRPPTLDQEADVESDNDVPNYSDI